MILCANATETFLDIFGDLENAPHVIPALKKNEPKMSCSLEVNYSRELQNKRIIALKNGDV